MTLSTGKNTFHFKSTKTVDPRIKPFGEWLPENRSFHAGFCAWLRVGGYSAAAVHIYSGGARLALGLWDKPIEQVEIDGDLLHARDYLEGCPLSAATRSGYQKGLNKLAQYLRQLRGLPEPQKTIHWGGYLKGVPAWLGEHLRTYVNQRARNWQADSQVQLTRDLLSRLCVYLRDAQPANLDQITPRSWFSFLGKRVKAGLKPSSSNLILRTLQSFLHFLREAGLESDARMLKLRPQKTCKRPPRDVPVPDLKVLLKAAVGPQDRAWLLLMLHAGLRTLEVRRLKWNQVDFARRTLYIEQSKNLKSRTVFLSPPLAEALEQLTKASEFVFSRHHRQLSRGYCQSRLKTLGTTCEVRITPHQFRHSAATLLLNAGMSIWGVKEILGHRFVDTTLGYARTYDSTLEREYQRAIKYHARDGSISSSGI